MIGTDEVELKLHIISILLNFFPWSIGYIYEAFDSQMGRNVALKMEKKDKSKNILKFEYQVLQHLKGQ